VRAWCFESLGYRKFVTAGDALGRFEDASSRGRWRSEEGRATWIFFDLFLLFALAFVLVNHLIGIVILARTGIWRFLLVVDLVIFVHFHINIIAGSSSAVNHRRCSVCFRWRNVEKPKSIKSLIV
jgi:hypothetical protein